MLSLRQFESAVAPATYSGMGSQAREYMASMVLDFGAQSRDDLPAFVLSFSHPVHVDVSLLQADSDAIIEDGPELREDDVDASALEGLSRPSPTDP